MIIRSTSVLCAALASGLMAVMAVLFLAAPAQAQVVLTNGDGIIRNSLCVGFDCQAGISFSDSTIILKENNTRLKFADTSNSPFPNGDWEIEANSNLSGGLNYLGFNDCGSASNDGGCAADLVFAVEGGARSAALYVESDGDVGLGTADPVLDLHIVTGNTPSLRLDQDGSSGFSPQTWDIAGNEANFFIRDVTAGSRLPLRIRPGAPTSAIDIAASGNIGIGLAAPTASLHISRSDGTAKLRVEETNAAGAARTVAQFVNNGRPDLVLANTSTSDEWSIGGGTNMIFKSGALGSDPGAKVTRFTLFNTGNATLTGTLTTGGGTCGGGCDAVFTEDYDLPSVKEHAEQMFALGYLPNVGPTIENAPINVSDKLGRMLNELEHAHIYIAQQDEKLADQDARIARQDAQIAELSAALRALQHRLAAE